MRLKFLLIPGIVLLVSAALIAAFAGILRSQAAALQRLNDQQIRKTFDLSELYSRITMNQLEVFDLLISAKRHRIDEQGLYEGGKPIIDTARDLGHQVDALASSYRLSAAERHALATLEQAWLRYLHTLVSAVRRSTVDLDRSFDTMVEANTRYREVDAAFGMLLEEGSARTAHGIRAVLAHTRQQFGRVSLVGAATLLLLSLFSLLVAHLLSRPIVEISRHIHRVTEEGDLGDAIPITSEDEVGRLAESFNKMIASLRATTVSKDWFEGLFASIVDGVIATDATAHVVLMNAVSEAMTGWTLAEAKGHDIDDVIQTSDQRTHQPVENLTHAVLRGEPACESEDDVLLTDRTGRQTVVHTAVAPIRARGGGIDGIVYILRDVTQKRSMEVQLRSAQKLEAIGQLAAGIAHEINTPVQFVGDNVRFLTDAFGHLTSVIRAATRLLEEIKEKRRIDVPATELEHALHEADGEFLAEEVPAATRQALDGIQRIAEVVGAMRAFAHPSGGDTTLIDVPAALDATLAVARNEWKYVAEAETRYADDLPMIQGYPGELNQALLSLVINAAQAIGDKVGEDATVKGRISVEARTRGTDRVEIRIHDTGTGIPDHVRERIFEPFFTTKDVGKGTGQGLAIAHAIIVEKHGGTLHFESTVGEGTTFIIGLPVAGPAARPEAPRAGAPAGAPSVLSEPA